MRLEVDVADADKRGWCRGSCYWVVPGKLLAGEYPDVRTFDRS